MSCPICFFREDHQKALKRQTFGTKRFERKLAEYKRLFVEGVRNMGSLARCGCHAAYHQTAHVDWTDSFLAALQDAEEEITNAFDALTSVYEHFITRNQKAATDALWAHLAQHHLLGDLENPLSVGRLFFRGREKDRFDEGDLRQFFHLPFSLREKVGNQRFSVSGQPMLYLSHSILGVCRELDAPPAQLAFAAFLPSYSRYYRTKIFSLTNHLIGCLENSLPGIFAAGSQLTYGGDDLAPNHRTIVRDIHKTVLLHLCTFPVEYRGGFVAEYVLPQMLSTALLEHGYAGLVFPSTRDYSDLRGHHRFSVHDLNLGVFVPYDREHEVNESLLQSFAGFTLDGSESLALTTADLLAGCEPIVATTKGSDRNNNDYAVAIAMLRLHIEYLESSRLDGVKYFLTDTGRLELEFFAKMLRHLATLVR